MTKNEGRRLRLAGRAAVVLFAISCPWEASTFAVVAPAFSTQVVGTPRFVTHSAVELPQAPLCRGLNVGDFRLSMSIAPVSSRLKDRKENLLTKLFFSARPGNQGTAATLDNNTEIDESVLRRLDGEMDQIARRRKKFEEQLSKVQSQLEETNVKLETIQTKRKKYLEGGMLGDLFGEEKNFSETTLRSAVKAMLWRVIAGTVTFATALRFSGSMSTALSIVGSDFFSKSFTMFVGERLMNKSQAGRKSGADDVGRSLAKALIWRLFAICNTLTMSVFFAKDLKVASKIAGSDAIFKTGLMFVYERVWAKVEWGKDYQIEFTI